MDRSEIRLKAIWKSVGFWIGLCVTLFLLWAWADSRPHLTKFGFRDTPRALEVTLRNSKAIVGISFPDETHSLLSSGGWEWVWDRSPHQLMGSTGSLESPWFAAGKIERIARYQSIASPIAPPASAPSLLMFEGDEIHLPFWAIVFGWIVVWLSTLGLFRSWQRRRVARAAPEGAEAV